jgi:uncharacterized protein YjiS (DUF1127 family)
MRILSQVIADTLSSECKARAAKAAAFTAPAKNAGSAAGSTRSKRSASQRPASEAMSRLVAVLSESFAVRREAMYPSLLNYPGFVDPCEVIDGERPGQRLLPRWQVQDQHENEAPRLNPGYRQTSENFEGSANPQLPSQGWSGTVTSCLTRFWSRICREWDVGSTVRGLQALDDQTLKDIGVHRSEIESVALHRDRYTR